MYYTCMYVGVWISQVCSVYRSLHHWTASAIKLIPCRAASTRHAPSIGTTWLRDPTMLNMRFSTCLNQRRIFGKPWDGHGWDLFLVHRRENYRTFNGHLLSRPRNVWATFSVFLFLVAHVLIRPGSETCADKKSALEQGKAVG